MKSKKTHNEWNTLVSEFEKSGVSMANFCGGNNLKPSTFIYWVKKFSSKASVPKLVKLETSQIVNIPQQIQIQIIIGNIKLEIPGIYPPEKISRLISVIREIH